MKSEDLKRIVKEKYGEIAKQSNQQNSTSCCSQTSDCCSSVNYTVFSESYEKLKDKVTKNGYTFIIVQRTEKKALYAEYCENVLIGWAVFRNKVLRAQPYPIHKKSLDAYEKFPVNSDFEKTAWVFQYNDVVLSKYHEL
jgi:hypothetical protein